MNARGEGADHCWIHVDDVYTFLHLGANPHEQKVGQNVKLRLSIEIPYRGTGDRLAATVDYSVLVVRVQEFIEAMEEVNLLEYLAERILDLIGAEFPGIRAARLMISKAYVPLPHFTGSVSIEAARVY